jgi:histidyl-tRNA synthetase
VVGTDSLICEAEIILMIKEIFSALDIRDYTIKVNHRGVLSGLAEVTGSQQQESSLFVAMDKLDKIGEVKVKEELLSKNISEKSVSLLFEILNFKGTTTQKTELLAQHFDSSDKGKKGIANLKEILTLVNYFGVSPDHIEFDISLARGLSYYTGTIFEVKINNVPVGSVSGGGRYDNLTGVFGLTGVSGTGISFGVDRLYDAMEELDLFPKEARISSKVLVTTMDESSQRYGLTVVQVLRTNGIAAEIYPDPVKLKKQLEYADKKMIPFVIVIGPEEVASGLLTLKNMETGEQQKFTFEQLLKYDF